MMRRRSRGVALITVLLASLVLAAVLSVMLYVSTAGLRRSVEDLRALQAQGGADAGAGWFRALLQASNGDVGAAIVALQQQGGVETIAVDSDTSIRVTVTPILASGGSEGDHRDANLEQNNNVSEAPVQVVSTAVVTNSGVKTAERTTTTLLRVFQNAPPYSEIVGVVDDAGPDAIDSPGDAAGQLAAPATTDLVVRAFVLPPGGGPPHEVDNFQGLQWSDGNTSGGGVLP
ncbi:MAG TPA: hypothetical protein VKT51_00395 [Candidatus Eremiobacteraceae bacterium]|nr:hypothetical protein [Candidatus Eremiobacteraceae bacterium]